MKATDRNLGLNKTVLTLGLLAVAALLGVLFLTIVRVQNQQNVVGRPRAAAECWSLPAGENDCKQEDLAPGDACPSYAYSSKALCTAAHADDGKVIDCWAPSAVQSAGGTCDNPIKMAKRTCLETGGHLSKTDCEKGEGIYQGGNTGSSGQVTDACAKCVVGKRGDLVSEGGLYGQNGWDLSSGNWPSIVNNWCSNAGPADCKVFLSGSCTAECKGVAFDSGGGGGNNTGGGGNNGGGGSGGNLAAAESTGPGCNPSSPGKVWSCYQDTGNCSGCIAYNDGGKYPGKPSGNQACFNNCFSKIKPGNGTYCKAYCDNGSANQACFDDCFKNVKPGNGTYCKSYCSNKNNFHFECVSGGGAGLVKLNDTDASIKYNGPWGSQKGGGGSGVAFQQDYHFAPFPLSKTTATQNLGANAEFTFTGSKVTLGLLGYSNRGKADIFIDGQKVESFSTETPTVKSVTWTSQTLSCGQHTVKVAQSDTGGATGGKVLVLDYVEYQKCGSSGGYACAKVSGTGTNATGCSAEGATCTPIGGDTGEVKACWGNLGVNGKCYDCNGDGAINILDFSCFAKHWLENIGAI